MHSYNTVPETKESASEERRAMLAEMKGRRDRRGKGLLARLLPCLKFGKRKRRKRKGKVEPAL